MLYEVMTGPTLETAEGAERIGRAAAEHQRHVDPARNRDIGHPLDFGRHDRDREHRALIVADRLHDARKPRNNFV